MIHTIQNEKLAISVKSLGAELSSVFKKTNNTEHLWQGEPNVWSGQSPILFPIIGRLLNDEFTYGGKAYTLEKHGFARRREFSLVDKTSDKLTFLLESNAETRVMFPFDFKLYITYEIVENSVKVSHVVENVGSDKMYFSLGAHPGFVCEIGDTLEFEKNEVAISKFLDKDGILCGKTEKILDNDNKIVITETVFDDDALIFEGLKSDYVTLKTARGNVKMTFGCAPYLGVWAKPAAPYVCIEPWFGVSDSYERYGEIANKPGIVGLEAGNKFIFEYEIQV